MLTIDARAEAILDLWLGPGEVPSAETRGRWWTKDPAFDQLLRERFGALLDAGARGEIDGWVSTARGALALVILLDQLSRNIHRGTPRAFAQDTAALGVAREALARGEDQALPLHHRVLLYMPFMHAERLDAQRKCLALFEQLERDAPPDERGAFQGNVEFARRHLAIIERFGRFPHRNAILGRPSTTEEEAFLREPGSSF